jgi:uncharacterized repeat protein (TIGR02543 family)
MEITGRTFMKTRKTFYKVCVFALAIILLFGSIYSFAGNSDNGITESAIQQTTSASINLLDEQEDSSEVDEDTEDEEDIDVTVTYYVNDMEYFKETIDKDTLSDRPADPAPNSDGHDFLYWYEEGAEDKPVSAYKVIKEDTEFYAMFSEDHVVYYHDTDGSEAELVNVAKDGTVNEPTFTPELEMGEEIAYWYDEENPDTPFVFGSTIDKNIHLYPKVEDRAVAYFVTQGPEVQPQSGNYGFYATDPTKGDDAVAMKRSGYTFSHWSATENGTESFDFANTKINGITRIYAVWTPSKVGYTINFWNEKANIVEDPGDPAVAANKDNYEFVFSKVIPASSGADVGAFYDVPRASADTTYVNAGANIKAILDYSDFNWSETKVINGDGSTIINVYYKRTVFKMTLNMNSGWLRQKNSDEKITTSITITAKLDQDISNLWPYEVGRNDGKVMIPVWGWAGVNKPTFERAGLDVMFNNRIQKKPSTQTVTYGCTWLSLDSYRIFEFYGESLNPNPETDTQFAPTSGSEAGKNRYYTLLETVEPTGINGIDGASYNYATSRYGFKAMPVSTTPIYSRVINPDYNINGKPVRIVRVYFTRDNFNISLISNGGFFEDNMGYTGTDNISRTLKYEEDMGVIPTPKKDKNVFLGWYTEEELINEFDPSDYDSKMPGKNLTLYAKWLNEESTVNYYDGTSLLTGYKIEKGKYIKSHELADTYLADVKVGDHVPGKGTFDGWYYSVGSNVPMVEFPLDIQADKDTYNLYAKWIKEDYTVTYYAEDEDSKEYTVKGVSSIRSGAKNTLALSGQKLLRIPKTGYSQKWTTEKNGGGTNFSAATKIMGNVNVYISYTINTYNATFEPQGGGPQPMMQYIKFMDKILYPNTVTRAGYTFKGWSTEADGGDGTMWDFDTSTMPANNVVLYAIWDKDPAPAEDPEKEDPIPVPDPDPENPTPDEPEKAVTNVDPTEEDTNVEPNVEENEGVVASENTSERPNAGSSVSIAQTEADEPDVAKIDDNATPLFADEYNAWALINLLLAIAGVILAGAIFIISASKKENDEQVLDKETDGQYTEISKRSRLLKVFTGLCALAGVIVFLLTEDMSLPMVLVDFWTIFNFIILVMEVVGASVYLRRSKHTEYSMKHM